MSGNELYRTVDMVGHKVIAYRRTTTPSGLPHSEPIEGRLLNWNSDGTVYVHVSHDQTSYGKVVRCLGEGMEFVE